MRVIPDITNGQESSRFRGGERLVLSYLVCEADGASLRECRDAPGIPNIGDAIPGLANSRVVFKTARPVSPGMARCFVHVEDGTSEGIPYETFRVTDTTGLEGSTTEVHPGTFRQFRVNMTSDVNGAKKTATLSYPIATRRIILEGLFTERPPGTVQSLANKVNSDAWQGMNRGFWRCDLAECSYSNRDGLYRVVVACSTKQSENWMSLWIARDDNGDHREIPEPILDLVRAAATGNGYQYDIVRNGSGILQTGLYALADFGAVLGDSF